MQDDLELDEIEDVENQGGLSKGKRALIFVIIGGALLAALFVLYIFASYSGYEEMSEVEMANEPETKYIDFRENLLSYSRDGAFYTDYNGNLIWTETYEMDDPRVKMCLDRLLLYDRQGSHILIQSPEGEVGEISTNLPIVDADVAATGDVSVLMQDGSTGYITLYGEDGNIKASGEVHTANTGYPVSVSISSDGEKMCLSLINLNDGDVKTTLNFYDFGSEGASRKDNITASFSYSDMIIPEVDYVDEDKLVAFGDSEIVIYTSAPEPKVGSEIFLHDGTASVFHNDSYIGVIEQAAGENTLTVWSMSGNERYSCPVKVGYNRCEFNKNDEVMITDGEDISLTTMMGVEKFNYHFNGGFYQLIPWESSRSYVLVEKGTMKRIRLK